MATLFFALWPDEEAQKKLSEVSHQFKDENLRLTRTSNLHITLAFLGEVSAYDQIALIQQGKKIQGSAFFLELNSIGCWRKPGILWVAPEDTPKPLTTLVEQLQMIIKLQGLNVDERLYKPHVTIARKLKQFTIPKMTIQITSAFNNFSLVVSKSTDNGVDYQVIHDWALKK
jgi:2'-5' RNA ligase